MPLTLVLALSADGKITSHTRHPAHFTSSRDLDHLLSLRAQSDALLIGRQTWQTDAMTQTAGPEANPARLVISRRGPLDLSHPWFHTPGGPRHLLFTEALPPEAPTLRAHATLHQEPLAPFLRQWQKNHPRLQCEGGGELARHLLHHDLVDTLHLTLASHTLLGGASAPTLAGLPRAFLSRSLPFALQDCQPVAPGEWFLTYQRQRSSEHTVPGPHSPVTAT